MLAALSPLSKEERQPLEAPPTSSEGRKALIEVLCGGEGGEALRQDWAEVALDWTFIVADSRESVESIQWFSSLVGDAPLPYGILFRIVCFLSSCLQQNREMEVAAVLTMLRDHVVSQHALSYDVAALLAPPALLILNSAVRIHFGIAQSILRALLERQLLLESRELLSPAAVEEYEANGGGKLSSPTWKVKRETVLSD